MEPQVAVSMRSSKGTAREIMKEVTACGAKTIQLDALHPDFYDLSGSGRRDLASTIRRFGLLASGIDFLIPPADWKAAPDQSLEAFADVVVIAEVVGNVPVGTLLPDDNEIRQCALSIGSRSGVIVSVHGAIPPSDPLVGWHLPITLLAKEDHPIEALAQAPVGPMAVRLKGDIVDEHDDIDGTTLDIDGKRVNLRELRGVLDAMQWEPTPIIDANGDVAVLLMNAWQLAGP